MAGEQGAKIMSIIRVVRPGGCGISSSTSSTATPARRPEGPNSYRNLIVRVAGYSVLLRHVPRPAERHHRPNRTRGYLKNWRG
ncbi:MAG: hypothetical protein ACLSAH_06750 [Bilophila wadsworthia]